MKFNPELSEEQRRRWDEDGFLIFQGLIPEPIIEGIRNRLSRLCDGIIDELVREGEMEENFSKEPFESRLAKVPQHLLKRYGRSWRPTMASRELFELFRTPGMVDVAEQLLGTDVMGHPSFQVRPRLPGQAFTLVPWHQDVFYFADHETGDGLNASIIGCWVPVVRVDRNNGCLQILPGSHKRGLLEHTYEEGEGKFREVNQKKLNESRAVDCEMSPGDVVMFSSYTLHRGQPNHSAGVRWSLDIRYTREGDCLGKAFWGWPVEGFKWVIRGRAQEETTFEEWVPIIQRLSN